MKKLLLSLLILFPALRSSAEEVNALMLHLASGKNVTCMLDELPVVTFCGNDLVIKTHMSSMTYLSTDVNKFTYTNIVPSIVDVIKTEVSLFSFDGHDLKVRGLAPNSTVTIFSVDGKKIIETKTNALGNETISLPSHSGSTYLVNTSVANFKITKP